MLNRNTIRLINSETDIQEGRISFNGTVSMTVDEVT
jgi:hypothetical protein